MANITGFSTNETIPGSSGDDFISGLAGDDIIYSGAGRDTIDGGDGNDTIYGEGQGTRNFLHGGNGDDVINFSKGAAHGDAGNDIFNANSNEGTGQMHIYGGDGDDAINLIFNTIYSPPELNSDVSHGHHIRGDSGADTFHFKNISSVSHAVVGRIEDFDSTRDIIKVDDVTIHDQNSNVDLKNLPSHMRVVAYAGESSLSHSSYINNYEQQFTSNETQQWLLIKTSAGGFIFYALEGARVVEDGKGGANNNNQESHFIRTIPDFADLWDNHQVNYVDPVNSIPLDRNGNEYVEESGGQRIEDDDSSMSDVVAPINGSSFGDLIAAGLNNDTVNAGGGNDHVWGGYVSFQEHLKRKPCGCWKN